MGSPFIVENRPGGSGVVGSEAVASSAPDGRTLLLTPGTILSDAAVNHRADPMPRFRPVINLTTGLNGMVVGPRTKAKSVKEIEAAAKQAPGKLFYSAAGNGSIHTLAMELFKYLTKTDILRVPFKGSNDALNYVVTGQVEMMTLPIAAAATFIKNDQLRLLATLSDKRSSLFPDSPSMPEAGYPGMIYESLYFLLAPAKTPTEIVTRLNKELNAILDDPAFRKKLASLGLTPRGGPPEALSAVIKAEQDRLAQLVKHAKIGK
jgi:tripartite-type tricarboxylate transporter receptor subunit TctC